MRRRRLGAVGLLLALAGAAVAVALAGGGGSHRRPGPSLRGATVSLVAGARTAALSPRSYIHAGKVDHAALATALRRLIPAIQVIGSGPARITYRYDRAATVAVVAGLGQRGARVEVPRTAIASSIRAPVVQQAQQNDCEAAALQIVLSTLGKRVDQRRLQAEMPRSGPLDPVGSGPGRTWGDPELGFVGRSDGGGAEGGFGVYQRPVQRLAQRHGAGLRDLTGADSARVFARLLSGHAVLAWVGLSDGPISSWRSPTGQPVTVNYGEHVVVLTGISPSGALTVDNPLSGALETWSQADFLARWRLLGTRALST